MRAALHRTHGGPDVLEVVDVPDPEASGDEVRLRVRATCLNRLDVLQREGPPLIPGFTLPHVAGMDVAGEVVEVGPDVDRWAVGDRVVVNPAINCGRCGFCVSGEDAFCPNVQVVGGNRPGGYAEFCVVPQSHLHRVPDDVGYDEAATVPTTYSTAWTALVVTGHLRAGEVVLVHGAGSGVSLAAVQLAKRCGATVIATSGSDEKLERVRKLGADVTINNRTSDLVSPVREATEGKGADMVFDHVGPALFQQSLFALRPHGRMVFCGSTTGMEATFNLPHAYHFGISLLGVQPYNYTDFTDMLRFYWRGGFETVIDSEFDLADIAAAQRKMESGDLFGKVVVHP